MYSPRRFGALVAAIVALSAFPAAAGAFGPVGADPAMNQPAGQMPKSCLSAPTAAPCVNAAVYYLDQARAGLGQGPYALPPNFVSLAPDQQAFVLSNLDRTLYGLPAVPGLTGALDADAAGGVQADDDPQSSDPSAPSYTANWAGAFSTTALAYDFWMYDDGPGSGNLDCTSSDSSGCWGHRRDVLWSFDNQTMGMGATAGVDPSGRRGYAMLIAAGSQYQPVYSYTWQQAVADGAGTNAYDPGLPQIPVPVGISVQGGGVVSDAAGQTCSSSCTFQETQGVPVALFAAPAARATFTGWSGGCTGTAACTIVPSGPSTAVGANFKAPPLPKVPKTRARRLGFISVRVTARTVRVHVRAPAGARLRCSLTPVKADGASRPRYHACQTRTAFRGITRGRYRLRVKTSTSTIAQVLTVR